MKNIRNYALAAAILAAACLTAAAQTAPGGKTAGASWDARLYNVAGKVFVKQGGAKEWTAVQAALPLKAGDTVRTDRRSSADISFDNRGIVALNASTIFQLKALKRKDSSFVLSAGRFVGKVTGLKARMEKMQVRTPTAVAAVRGTEFAVRYDRDKDETSVNVFAEGEVVVTSLDETGNPVGESITVIPRHEVLVKKEMEAMSLTRSPGLTDRDPGIISARQKLGLLDKTYKPLQERERQEQRDDVFQGGKGPAAPGGSEGSPQKRERSQEGATDKSGARKGGAGAKAAAEGKSGDGAAAGDTGARQKGGARSAADGGGARKSQAEAASKPRDGEDEPHKMRRKGGLDGDDSPRHMRTKGGGGKGRSGGGDEGGTGPRIKSASGSGQDDGEKSGSSSLSRSAPPTEKNVDTIVAKIQSNLAYTGNGDLLGSSELRSIVQSAIKGSATSDDFTLKLNDTLSARLAEAAETSGATLSSSLQSKPIITTKEVSGITKPTITTPSITKPSIGNTDTKLKRN